MNEKKLKTRDEWKGVINSLSPDDFQNLCYDLIRNNNFINAVTRGKGGDGGRDLEAEFVLMIAKEEKREKCWFQCKRQKAGVNFKQFSTEVQKAQDQGIKRFFIVSNADSTPDCKDDITNWNQKNRCEINDWTGTKFLDILFEIPDICRAYFPDEEVPPLIDIKKPETALQKSADLGNRFGIQFEFKTSKEINLNNPHEVAEELKNSLIKLKDTEVNIKALLYSKMSIFFFALQREEDALMFLNKSLEITPKNEEALLNKGYILEKNDQLDESTECYNELLKINPKNKLALNNKAHNLRRKGELEEALKLVDKSLGIDSEFIIAIQTKTDILKTLDRSDDALAFLESKSEALKKSTGLQQLKVDLYIDLIDLKAAHNLNQEILKENPQDINAINNQGVIYEKNSKYQNKEKYLKLAYDCFEQTITSNRKFSIGWSNKTVVLLNAGQIDQAEEIIDTAYAFFPRHPYVLNKKGVVLRSRKKPKEALKYFDKALKFYYREEFLIDRARTYLELRRWRKAISDAEHVLKNNKKNADAWLVKAQASRPLHEPTKAKMFEKKAQKCQKKPRSLLED